MTTETLTLSAWLLERIAEDEAVARAVGVEARRPDNSAIDTGDDPWPSEAWFANHFTPARVLARCAADRAIVGAGPSECGGYADQDEFNWKHYPDPDYAGHCDGCAAAESYDASWRRTLRALASVYADAPGYREEWAL